MLIDIFVIGILIKRKECEAQHIIKNQDLIDRKESLIVFKCKNCLKPIKISLNEKKNNK